MTLGETHGSLVRPRRRPVAKPFRRWARYQFARGALATLRNVPRPLALGTFAGLAAVAHDVMPHQRRLVRRQIDIAYADRSDAWRRGVARRAFVELALSAVDVARLARERPDELLRSVELPHRLRLAPLLSGRGAVAVGGHLGAWELVPPLVAALGARVSVLVRPLRERRLDELVSRLRSAHGVAVMERSNDARSLLTALRSGRVVAIAADQRPRGRQVSGTLLGRAVQLPAGPAALAIAARVPLVPVAMRRRGRRHQLLVGRPIGTPGGTREEAEARMMSAYAEQLGRWIEAAPEQWAWFHERWKGRS